MAEVKLVIADPSALVRVAKDMKGKIDDYNSRAAVTDHTPSESRFGETWSLFLDTDGYLAGYVRKRDGNAAGGAYLGSLRLADKYVRIGRKEWAWRHVLTVDSWLLKEIEDEVVEAFAQAGIVVKFKRAKK